MAQPIGSSELDALKRVGEIAREAEARLADTSRRVLLEADLHRLISQEPGFMELALAIGDAAWGQWNRHGYRGKVACAAAAKAAIEALRDWELPPGIEPLPKPPVGLRLVRWLRS